MELLRSARREDGAILVTTLLKAVVVIGLLVVVMYDGFSIARTQVTVRDNASQAAQVALTALQTGATQKQAYQKTLDYLHEQDSALAPGGYVVKTDPLSVTVTVTKTAQTMVAGRLPFLADTVSPTAVGVANKSAY